MNRFASWRRMIHTFLCGGSRLPFGSGAIPFRVCKLAKRRSKRFCAEDRGFLSEAKQFPFGKPLECTESAPGVHRECTGSAPGVHHECTKRAPGVNRSAPGVHQECTRSAPGMHQECTKSLGHLLVSQQCSAVHDMAT